MAIPSVEREELIQLIGPRRDLHLGEGVSLQGFTYFCLNNGSPVYLAGVRDDLLHLPGAAVFVTEPAKSQASDYEVGRARYAALLVGDRFKLLVPVETDGSSMTFTALD